jgi:hypothetical protein
MGGRVANQGALKPASKPARPHFSRNSITAGSRLLAAASSNKTIFRHGLIHINGAVCDSQY